MEKKAKFLTYTPPLQITTSLIECGLDHTYPSQEIAVDLETQNIWNELSIKLSLWLVTFD